MVLKAFVASHFGLVSEHNEGAEWLMKLGAKQLCSWTACYQGVLKSCSALTCMVDGMRGGEHSMFARSCCVWFEEKFGSSFTNIM